MSVNYLIDTCVLSELSKRRPDPRTVSWLGTVDNLAVPMAAVLEISKGAHGEISKPRADALMSWIGQLFESDLFFLPTDRLVARLHGRMLAIPDLRRLWVPDSGSKKPRYGQDLHVAAAAIAHGYVVATFDIDDFLLIQRHFPELVFYNPREDRWYSKTDFTPDTTRRILPITQWIA